MKDAIIAGLGIIALFTTLNILYCFIENEKGIGRFYVVIILIILWGAYLIN